MKDDSIAVETVFNFKPNDSQADTPLTAAIGAAVRQLFPQKLSWLTTSSHRSLMALVS